MEKKYKQCLEQCKLVEQGRYKAPRYVIKHSLFHISHLNKI